jgi:hypothetical protein
MVMHLDFLEKYGGSEKRTERDLENLYLSAHSLSNGAKSFKGSLFLPPLQSTNTTSNCFAPLCLRYGVVHTLRLQDKVGIGQKKPKSCQRALFGFNNTMNL